MQQQIVGDIKITPAEVRRYFKDLPQDSIPFIPPCYAFDPLVFCSASSAAIKTDHCRPILTDVL